MRPLTRAEIFSYRSTGPGIGAAAWAAQDAHGGEPGATCGHEADADFEQDEHLLMWPQPARPTTRKRATIPSKRVRDIEFPFEGAGYSAQVHRRLPACDTPHIDSFSSEVCELAHNHAFGSRSCSEVQAGSVRDSGLFNGC